MHLCAAMLLCLQQMDPGELEKAVDQAITKGVEWLKKQQKTDGSFGDSSGPTYGGGGTAYHNRPGIAALSLLALLKSEVPPNDPVIQKGFKFLYEYVGNSGNMISNYDMGVILMAFESLYEGAVNAQLRKKGKKPTERAGDSKEPKYQISANDAKILSGLIKRLLETQTKAGGWRYGANFTIVGSDEDMSATQIVLLGLKSATRMRLVVDPQAFLKAMNFVIASQEKDGPKVERPADVKTPDRGTYVSLGEDKARGWAYEKKGEPDEMRVSGGMTCAGLTALLIGKSILGKASPKASDQAIYDGFAWLYTKWTMEANPDGRRDHYYYLYGIERVATLGMFEKIGKHYWYKEGAEVLVRRQNGDGSWDGKSGVAPTNVMDTCYALLFLKRGTIPIGDVMTGRGGGK
ncbi:MAG: hypothetical protein HYY17_10635 [Planctomycetes bacterium]|nr:hypothetical protein [Planctomycetota bacterium]